MINFFTFKDDYASFLVVKISKFKTYINLEKNIFNDTPQERVQPRLGSAPTKCFGEINLY